MRRLTELPQYNEEPADDDLIYAVDVSNTIESPEGTSQALPYRYIKAGLPPLAGEFALLHKFRHPVTGVANVNRAEIELGDLIRGINADETGYISARWLTGTNVNDRDDSTYDVFALDEFST